MDVGTLSRRVRRENPDITSPLTKKRAREILSHFHRYLELRVPRRPRSFAKRAKTDTISKVGHHMPLCGYACSFKNLPRSHSTGAVRRVTTDKPLELLSSPHIIETMCTKPGGRDKSWWSQGRWFTHARSGHARSAATNVRGPGLGLRKDDVPST